MRFFYTGFVASVLLFLALAGRAQEPAYYNGNAAARFDEGPDRFHYLFPCEVPSAFSAEMTPAAPGAPTEHALCWPAVAGLFRVIGEGKLQGGASVAGTFIVSAHNVRFIPGSVQDKALYFDVLPGQMLFRSGLPEHPYFLVSNQKDSFFRLFLRTACLTCKPGDMPAGTDDVGAHIADEITLIQDAIRNFDPVYKKVEDIVHLIRVGITPAAEPTVSDPAPAMGLYAELNRKLLPLCPETSHACIQSYAAYQACKSASPSAACGDVPSCSATCPLRFEAIQALGAMMCTSKTLDYATLVPDWTGVAKAIEQARLARPPGSEPLKITPIPAGSPPVDYMGKPLGQSCSVESAYATALMAYDTRNAGMHGKASTPTAPGDHLLVPQATMQAHRLSGPEPVYPPVARAAHVTGAVTMTATVSEKGLVTDISDVKGPEMLQFAATEAVRQWTYEPYLVGSTPVAVKTLITVNFSFDQNPAATPALPLPAPHKN